MSGTCISLSGSTQCPAFNISSISTNPNLFTDFPFLQNVSNLADFDRELSRYVLGSYVERKYDVFLGCQGVDLSNTSEYYARYTTSTICNGLIQSSGGDCDLSDEQLRPLCAEDCALMASSEEEIVVNDELCPQRRSDYLNQIRSDFSVCTGPEGALTATCISAADNEPNECGYRSNLIGLCGYCASSSPNSTDSCCVNANASSRCQGVDIPTPSTSFVPIFTSTSDPAAGDGSEDGLSGGQIAGIVIGSVAGFALLAALIAFGLIYYCRRRREAGDDSSLNKPNPQRKGSPLQQPGTQPNFAGAPGRVARMSALREIPSSSPERSRNSTNLFGGAKYSDTSDSEGFASPGAMSKKIPPTTGKRQGSLSSGSALAGAGSDTSPRSGTIGQYSSPEGLTSGQSEQLSSFQDYYSQDNIHPGDKVAVLWAYQPRAGDEFGLERGEMLKVIGIWDDGWATGVRVPETAEEYDARHREQRDSGVSSGSQRTSPAPSGEIKAFPLVCVCLPQHWSKIIEGGQGDESP
ncbi:SH3 domain protein [Aspergillus lucknowensis]|uniref:SH3 domain-containing protein n=1 Tax=Aspergillus lucknowensis TaxID=176173 RepID=A0ABR4LMG7_9EURO